MINMRFTPLLTTISQKQRKIGWGGGGEIEERGRKNIGRGRRRSKTCVAGKVGGGREGVGESE
jgi:hypothetical protein